MARLRIFNILVVLGLAFAIHMYLSADDSSTQQVQNEHMLPEFTDVVLKEAKNVIDDTLSLYVPDKQSCQAFTTNNTSLCDLDFFGTLLPPGNDLTPECLEQVNRVTTIRDICHSSNCSDIVSCGPNIDEFSCLTVNSIATGFRHPNTALATCEQPNGAATAFCRGVTTNTCIQIYDELNEDYVLIAASIIGNTSDFCLNINSPYLLAQCLLGLDMAFIESDLQNKQYFKYTN